MKNVVLVFLLAAFITGCQREMEVAPQKGSLLFSLSDSQAKGGRVEDVSKPVTVVISIKDAQGNFVEQDRQLKLFNFGQYYTTESLELLTGDYTVTKFQVVDENSNIFLAAPLEGSELAKLVIDPLPVKFSITKDGSTLVAIETIRVGQNKPENFGYASFGFKIVEPEQDIHLTFLQSTNPFMSTKGYDSAIVSFTSGSTVVRKKLKVISPVEARGSIKPSELGVAGGVGRSWTVKVNAYYESIDEVLSNLHINETVASAFVDITPDASLIKFEGDQVKLTNSSGVYMSKYLSWEDWAHVTDETGYFHLVVKNDICNPLVKVDLFKDDIYYGYYEKSIWTTAIDGSDFVSFGSKYGEIPVMKGAYTDNNTFADFCPSSGDDGKVKYGDFYFGLDTDHGWLYAYLVWLYKDTPIDPEHPDGAKKKVGSFQLKTTTKADVSAGGRRAGN